MAVRFEKNGRRAKNPGTRLYTPAREKSARVKEPAADGAAAEAAGEESGE